MLPTRLIGFQFQKSNSRARPMWYSPRIGAGFARGLIFSCQNSPTELVKQFPFALFPRDGHWYCVPILHPATANKFPNRGVLVGAYRERLIKQRIIGGFQSREIKSLLTEAGFPYPDPYYRSIFYPYDAQPYAAQPYPAQPMVHVQLMGLQQAVVPLPSEAVEEPVFLNANCNLYKISSALSLCKFPCSDSIFVDACFYTRRSILIAIIQSLKI